MSEPMQRILDGVADGYLRSWRCIQTLPTGEWWDYPVEAQISHLLAEQISMEMVNRNFPRKHAPVCESLYWRPETDGRKGRESRTFLRADVWSPDVGLPRMSGGWFVEIKLAHIDGKRMTIGGESWSKIVAGFIADLRRLLAFSVPEPSAVRTKTTASPKVRCSFVIVLKGSGGTFEELSGASPEPVGARGIRKFSDVEDEVWSQVRGVDTRVSGCARVTRFLHGALTTLQRVEGVRGETLKTSKLQSRHGHQVQAVAISWLQSAPIEL